MKGLLRKDLYLMIKYCRLFFILIIVFSFAGAWNNNLFFCIISYYNFQHYPGKPAFLR